MSKFRAAALALLITVSIMLSACQPSQNWTPSVANQATDFELTDLNGQTVSLSELRGRPVLVNFWATWCGPCIHEMPFLQGVYEQTSGSELVILAINIGESATKVQQFMDNNGYSFPVLLDTDGQVSYQYQVSGIPTSLFINEEGIIEKRQIGAYASQAALEADLDSITGD